MSYSEIIVGWYYDSDRGVQYEVCHYDLIDTPIAIAMGWYIVDGEITEILAYYPKVISTDFDTSHIMSRYRKYEKEQRE